VIDYIIFALWFFLPAGLANAAPVFANKIPKLNNWKTPLDLGKHLNNKRLLGDNKTWRGFSFGVFIAGVTFVIQQYFTTNIGIINNNPLLAEFAQLPAWFGLLLGAGALGGDALESLVKRQIGIKSGESWFPFDQIDYIIGGILLSSLVTQLSATQNFSILIVWFGLHLISTNIGYLLGLKEKPI
jgi:CDP-2,3-bis-(O-geranylgeranyl)-sn-glycerol synthase